jgi:hypothetical protein
MSLTFCYVHNIIYLSSYQPGKFSILGKFYKTSWKLKVSKELAKVTQLESWV